MRYLFLCLMLAASLISAETARAEIIISYNNVDTQWDYSGTYMFTVAGNDSQILKNGGSSADAAQLIAYINEWFGNNTDLGTSYLDTLTPYDQSAGGATSEHLSVQYGDSNTHGSWTSDAPIEFYVVKGGNSFALYWLGENGASSGTWTSEQLTLVGKGNIPQLSHFTGYNAHTSPPMPTPEPASLLLLGMGALALSMANRKRKQA